MKGMLLVGISAVIPAMALSSSAWGFSEANTAFIPEDPMEQHQIVAASCERRAAFAGLK